MRMYDENYSLDDGDDEFAGYTVVDENSIYKKFAAEEEEQETIATPIPQNEQTVLLNEPHTGGLKDGVPLEMKFTEDNCILSFNGKQIGVFRPAYIKKLKIEREGQKISAFYKAVEPPMVLIVFGEGTVIPEWENRDR